MGMARASVLAAVGGMTLGAAAWAGSPCPQSAVAIHSAWESPAGERIFQLSTLTDDGLTKSFRANSAFYQPSGEAMAYQQDQSNAGDIGFYSGRDFGGGFSFVDRAVERKFKDRNSANHSEFNASPKGAIGTLTCGSPDYSEKYRRLAADELAKLQEDVRACRLELKGLPDTNQSTYRYVADSDGTFLHFAALRHGEMNLRVRRVTRGKDGQVGHADLPVSAQWGEPGSGHGGPKVDGFFGDQGTWSFVQTAGSKPALYRINANDRRVQVARGAVASKGSLALRNLRWETLANVEFGGAPDPVQAGVLPVPELRTPCGKFAKALATSSPGGSAGAPGN
jgi:hypothetical protein